MRSEYIQQGGHVHEEGLPRKSHCPETRPAWSGDRASRGHTQVTQVGLENLVLEEGIRLAGHFPRGSLKSFEAALVSDRG